MTIKFPLTNNFGEETENVIGSKGTQTAAALAFSNSVPPKSGVAALSALGGGATLADLITSYNALLAALKVVS